MGIEKGDEWSLISDYNCFGSSNLKDGIDQTCSITNCGKKEECKIVSDMLFPDKYKITYNYYEWEKLLNE